MALPKEDNHYIADLGNAFLAEKINEPYAMNHTHIHSVYELYFCPAAIAQQCVISGREYSFSYPAVILVKPYTIHSMSATESLPEGRDWYIFSFGKETAEKAGMDILLDEMLTDHMGILFQLTSDQAFYLEDVLRFLFDSRYPLKEKESLTIFSFFLRRLYSLTERGQLAGVGTADGDVQQIMQYICENFHTPLTADIVAERFFVSRSKLDRDFKSAIGVTSKGFTELCRLHCAQNLLVTQKNVPISYVAQKSGFPSENYFYRFFRQHTGMTPTQYKNMVGKNRHI